MSSNQELLWEVTFAPKDEFTQEGDPTGLDVIDVMKFYCIATTGRNSISRKKAAKIAAAQLWKHWNAQAVRPIKEQYVAERIVNYYEKFLYLSGQNPEKRTEAWIANHRDPFRVSMDKTFDISSTKAGPKKDEAKNNPGEKGGNGPEEEDILAENVEVEKEASKKSTSEANEVSTATISCISRTVTFAFTTNSIC